MTARDTPAVAVPDRPRVVVVLHADGSGTVNGSRVRMPSKADPRTVLMTEACRYAATLGRPVRVEAHDPDGVWDLVAHPDGSVTASGGRGNGARGRRPVLRRVRGHRDDAPDPDAGDPGPAGDRGTEPEPGDPAWYHSSGGPTRPRPAAEPAPAADPAAADPAGRGTFRTGAGLVPGPDGARGGPDRPVVWSGRTPARRPVPSRSLIGGLVAGALVVAALIVLTVPRSGDGTAQDAAGAISAVRVGGKGAGALDPSSMHGVAVPPGYGRSPVWAVAVAGWTRSVATDDGTVLTRDPTGHVLLLDPATGRTIWSSPEKTTNDLGGPWPASVDGARAAVVAGPGRLTYWRLPSAAAAQPGASPSSSAGASAGAPSGTSARPGASSPAGAAVTVPLAAGATVSWSGPAPLVHQPNRTVAVVRSGALVAVPLPPGARALAADLDGVLAATGTTWLRQPAGRPPVAPKAIPKPANAGAAPVRVEAVGTGLLLSVWPKAKGTGQVVGLMDTRSGRTVVQTEVTAAADLRTFGVVREVGGTQLALGPVLVDTYAAKIDLLDQRYVVKGLSRGHAWTLFNGTQATDLHLTSTGDFTAYLFGDGEAALPVGVSRLPDGTSRAVVTVPVSGGWVLAGLAAS